MGTGVAETDGDGEVLGIVEGVGVIVGVGARVGVGVGLIVGVGVATGGLYVTIKPPEVELPFVSTTVIMIVFMPDFRTIPVILQLAVPIASPPPPRSLVQDTRATLTLSEAVPERLIVDLLVV
jgi:hypothetical protein